MEKVGKQEIPRDHKCGNPWVAKSIGIDEKIFGKNSLLADYCPVCKIYSFSQSYSKKIESKDPADIVHFYRTEIMEKKPRTNQREVF